MRQKMKIIMLLLIMVVVSGCSKKQEITPKGEYNENYTLQYYYLETCKHCKEFEKVGIPLIEEEFGGHMKIVKYDLDDITIKEHYDETLDKLVLDGFDYEEYYGTGPFLVLDGYFAKLGIFSGDEQEFLEDLKKAVTGQPLGDELTNDRYLFKDTKVKQ